MSNANEVLMSQASDALSDVRAERDRYRDFIKRVAFDVVGELDASDREILEQLTHEARALLRELEK